MSEFSTAEHAMPLERVCNRLSGSMFFLPPPALLPTSVPWSSPPTSLFGFDNELVGPTRHPKAAWLTQLGRAMQSLNIDLICANTPAAKGRVERAHRTLQDRLVKELRLRDIVDRDAADAYAPEFAESYNQRFARVPRNDHDAHRRLQPQDDLERIFTLHDKRRLTSNLTPHHNRVLYVVEARAPGVEHARGKLVDVRELENGEVVIEHNGTVLPARIFPKEFRVRQGATESDLA